MRTDAIFIGIEVDDDAIAERPELAAHLSEVCPVGIYRAHDDGGLQIVAENVDECVLCGLCLDSADVGIGAGAVKVLKLYDGGSVLQPAA